MIEFVGSLIHLIVMVIGIIAVWAIVFPFIANYMKLDDKLSEERLKERYKEFINRAKEEGGPDVRNDK